MVGLSGFTVFSVFPCIPSHSPGISDLNMAIEKQHNDGSGFAPLDYYIKYSVAWLLRMLTEN